MLGKFIEFSEDFEKRTLHINHYRRAALITVTLAIFLLILYAYLGCTDELGYSKWFLNFLPLPGFLGHLLSSTTYIGNALDQRHNKDRQLLYWSTSTGIALGLVVGITLSLMLPGAACFSTILTSMIFTMRCISTYAGLFSRACTVFSSILNYWRGNKLERHWTEVAFLLIALIGGLTCGIALFVHHKAKMISLLGVVTFFTPGLTAMLAFAPAVAGLIFISMFTSALMSGTDYFSKGLTCFKEMILNRTFEPAIQRFHEYRGSLLGGVLSCVVGLILIIAHAHILCGAMGVLTAVMIAATSFSIIDGVFSRLGFTFDGLFNKEDSNTKKIGIIIATVVGYTGILALTQAIRHCCFPYKTVNVNDNSQLSEAEEENSMIANTPSSPPTQVRMMRSLSPLSPRPELSYSGSSTTETEESPSTPLISATSSQLSLYNPSNDNDGELRSPETNTETVRKLSQPLATTTDLSDLTEPLRNSVDDTESIKQLSNLSFLSRKSLARLPSKNGVSYDKFKLSCAIL